MIDVLARLGGLVAVIALGYGFKQKGWATKEDAKLLSHLFINVTLPAALLSSASALDFHWGLFLPFAIGFASNLIMDLAAYLRVAKADALTKGSAIMQLSGYSIGGVALPFVQAFFPASYLAPVLLFDVGNAFLVLGGNYMIATSLDAEQEKVGLTGVLKNLSRAVPLLVYGLVLALSALRIEIPNTVLLFSETAAKANGFLAMFMLGLLVDINVDHAEIKDLRAILGLRFGLSAILAAVAYFFLPLDQVAKQMMVICLFSPVSTVAPIYALKLGDKSSRPANVNSLSIIISLVILFLLVLAFV